MINASMVWVFFETDILTLSNTCLYGIGSFLASLSLFLVFLFVISEEFVKVRGFRYAKSLLESCEVKIDFG